MESNKLKKNIYAGVLSFILTNGALLGASTYSYAAPVETARVVSDSNEEPNSFTARIKKILDEYHAKIGAVDSTDLSKSTQDSAPPAAKKLPELDVPITPAKDESKLTDSAIAEQSASSDRINSQAELYNFDWQGTPIAQTLYAVAKIAGKGVVVNGQLQGQVYTSLHNVTCTQALDYLSRAFNFNWMIDEENNAIVISTSDIMKQSRIFDIHYADKDKIKDELKALGIDEKNIYANMESGTVSVTGTPYQLAEAAKRISSIDKPVSQCLIVAQLIEVNHGRTLDLGMQYSLPTYSHTGTDDSTSKNLPGNVWEKLTFSASASASKELSKGKVVARPMVMMLNGQEGVVNFGDKVPVLTTTSTSSSTQISVDYKDVGTTLKVTPVINQYTNEISMKIDTEISNISKWITSGQTTAPQISSRHATTSAHLRSGQSFVIGGLMSVTELDNLSGIPGLMDLPILGKIFSYHDVSKTYGEVYIMITPYIVTDQIDPKELLKKVGE
ncbi:MAG: ral secretion pathway protein GspD [Firmicutes bacterium]|nr:ral secretion pathway protein GspD [Bacillota bacterium]